MVGNQKQHARAGPCSPSEQHLPRDSSNSPPTGEHYGPGVNEGLNQQDFNKQIDAFTAMRKSSLTEC
jgi:hypothetical protein